METAQSVMRIVQEDCDDITVDGDAESQMRRSDGDDESVMKMANDDDQSSVMQQDIADDESSVMELVQDDGLSSMRGSIKNLHGDQIQSRVPAELR